MTQSAKVRRPAGTKANAATEPSPAPAQPPRPATKAATKAKTQATPEKAEEPSAQVTDRRVGQSVDKASGTAKPPKKPKAAMVRDGFTMPEEDFALIAQLKKRAAAAGRETKKSEVLRAGLHVLAALESAALMAALTGLAPVKIGRPRKGH